MMLKVQRKAKEMSEKDRTIPDSFEETQTLHLDSVFTRDVTATGSFDIRGDIWASTFGKVVQALPVPALLIDEHQTVIIANEACSKLSPDYKEILDAPFSRLFPVEAAAEKARSLLSEVFSSRKPLVAESLLQLGKGRIWGRMTYRPIRIIDVRLVLLVIENLTRERQQLLENKRLREELEKRVEQRTADLKESNRRLRRAVEEEKRAKEALNQSEELLLQVFNNMSSGVLVLGRNREIQLANRSALSFLRIEAPVIGKTLDEVVPDFDISGFDSNSHDQTETRVTLRDGTNRLFGFTATTVEADGRTVILFRDITEIVEVRERKRRADELALVGEMVSRLSHEIKNPLASIVVGLKTMQRAFPQSSRYGQILQLISEEVDVLTKIVNQLLEAARPRVPSPRPIYVEPLLERCMDANGLLAVRRGVGLELVRASVSSMVVADDQAMLRVMEILIQNALDASSRGGGIRIGWRELDEAGKAELVPGYTGKVVALFVEDTGPGIPDEISADQSRIFKAFVSTKVSGSGLGLTVAREIVESHGGVLVVDSLSNQGTRVRILLPNSETIPCWDWEGNRAVDCPSPQDVDCENCDMRSSYTGVCCWTVKGRSHHAETGQWPKRCRNCGFFRSSSLTPFFRSRLVK